MTSFQAVVDRIEDDYAVLRYNNKDIFIPIDLMPDGIKEGEALDFSIGKNQEAAQNNEDLAKEILNQILNPKDST